MGLIRLPDWADRLHVYIKSVQLTAFAPYTQDCMTFTLRAVDAMCGSDLMSRVLTPYATLEEGLALCMSMGYTTPMDLLATEIDEVAPIYALGGDVMAVSVPGEDHLAMGICQGSGVYLPGPSGVVIVRRDRAVRALKLGEA